MDNKKLINLVEQAQADEMDYFRLAALIAAEQKEADAQVAEAMGANSVAATIRAGA